MIFASNCPRIVIQDQSTAKQPEVKEKDTMKCPLVTEKEREELDEGDLACCFHFILTQTAKGSIE